jgi:hypothetical protein
MKCVGAEDGSQPCQRCRRTGVEYVLIQYPRYHSSHSPAQVCVRETQTRPEAGLKVRLILSITYGFFQLDIQIVRGFQNVEAP